MVSLVSVLAEEVVPVATGQHWFSVAALVLGSSFLATIAGGVVGSVRSSAETRRKGYADMSGVLISRVEFPYRVRRRTSDSVETLAALSQVGSDIQERLAAQRAWVAGESKAMARVLDDVCGSIDPHIRTAAADAWCRPAITRPEDMVLGEWGPGASARISLDLFRRALAFRFGWRRLVPGFVWYRWVAR